MEKLLNMHIMLSLEETALRRVAILLSNDCEIPFTCHSDADWEKWLSTNEDKVKYKLSKLPLPELLRKEIIDKVRPIRLEIRKWTECLRETLGDSVDVDFSILYWTTAGTIDYKKTAEALLDCEVLDYEFDIEKRFELASLHCLEDYITPLWEELARCGEKFFLGVLGSWWLQLLNGEFPDHDVMWPLRNLTSYNQWAFENSAKNGNKTATEYFFRKLTHEEREASIMRTTLDVLSDSPQSFNFSYVLCFLLSVMNPEQQMETIKGHSVHVLLCFYQLPWPDLLVKNACRIWPSLPTSSYDKLLDKILAIAKFDRSYQNSFRELFMTSPLDFKKYFVHGESGTNLNKRIPALFFLRVFFTKEDSNSIGCIFRNLDAADRAALVFNRDVLHLFFVRREDGRRMVKVCLREAELSKEDRERLKMGHSHLRSLIEELYGSDETAGKERKDQKRKLEDCSD